ncbi:MAG: hypothetical protein ACI4TF_01670 [Oliverpabstia sp.]
MSKFSEHLGQCIIGSGMTENQLAKVSGFNRSYIALMKNGLRVSPDTGKMMKLIDTLNLPPYEYDEIWSEYIRARMGDSIYERNQAVIDFLESFNNSSDVFIRSSHRHEISDVKTVNNRMDLEYLIKAVMEQEALDPKGYIRIIMQPDMPVLKSTLPEICKNNKNLRIDHIICLDHPPGGGYQKDELYNIKMLKFLIPVLIFSNNENYRIYHYYDQVTSHFSSASLLPCVVLTNHYVINMNASMNKGLMIKDKEIIEFYDNLFRELKQGCRILLKWIKSKENLCKYFDSKNKTENIIYTASQQPYIGELKMENPAKIISYCTKKGLRLFAEKDTKVKEQGNHSASSNGNNRLLLLRKLLDALKHEKYELYFMEENKINFPKALHIYSCGLTEAVFIYDSKKDNIRFVLKEKSFTKILSEFFRDFMKTPHVSSLEETIRYIEQLIDELSEDKKGKGE